MPCHLIQGAVICEPTTFNWRTRRHCPTCVRIRWMHVAEAIWYGATITCLGCGEAWSDGERLRRPFARGWRQDAVRRARRKPYTTKAKARAALHVEIRERVAP
jgi:hypothetical protein